MLCQNAPRMQVLSKIIYTIWKVKVTNFLLVELGMNKKNLQDRGDMNLQSTVSIKKHMISIFLLCDVRLFYNKMP